MVFFIEKIHILRITHFSETTKDRNLIFIWYRRRCQCEVVHSTFFILRAQPHPAGESV
jgi:hypothetical protein